MEPAHFQAALDGNLSEFPFCNINNINPDMSDIFNKVSPSGNTLLHVAASRGHVEIIELMVRNFPFLIFKKNYKGDTALHLAVRAGKLSTVKILVDCANQIPNIDEISLLKMKNNGGNTALHEALLVLVESKESVDTLVAVSRYLVTEDPEVSYHQNNASKSPLCLAVESDNKDILEYILKALPHYDGLVDPCLEGKSPVHVAIEQRKLDALKIMKEQNEVLLLLRDEKENTPLHCAASIGYLEGVHYLLEMSNNWALERNKEGLYPLHLACENGDVKVTDELLRKWPDPTELIDNNGRNILHVAAKNGREEVVRFLLKEDGIGKLMNEMDKDGNTPFHLAASHHHSMVVASMLWDKRLNPDLVNYQGLTAYVICLSNMPRKVLGQRTNINDGNLNASGIADHKNSAQVNLKRSKEFQKMMTLSILFMYHEFFKRWCIRHHHPISSTKRSRIKNKPPPRKQDLNNTINNLFVVAALIVGAAFAGALQIPMDGGKHDDDHSGPSMLVRFLFANVITMNLSIIAAFSLCLALLLDTNLAVILVSFAFLLLELALTFMGSAFFAAISLRMDTYHINFSNYLTNLTNVSFGFQTSLLTVPLLTLMAGWEVLPIIIYFIIFCLYFVFYRLRNLIYCNGLKTFVKIMIRFSLFGLLFYVVFYTSFFY